MTGQDHDMVGPTPDAENDQKLGLEDYIFGTAFFLLSCALCYICIHFYSNADSQLEQTLCAVVIAINAAYIFWTLFAVSYRLITTIRDKLR